MRFSKWLVPIVFCAACSSDSGGGGGGGDDVAGDPDAGGGGDPDAANGDPIVAPPLTWTYVEIPGTECIDGTPSGFSVNLNPDSPNVVIYLEGGGACFNNFCESIFTWSGNIPGSGGLFDRASEVNPVADWNMVYVPYCTGDVYGGNKISMVAGEMRHFKGYTNFAAFLSRLVPTFPDADQVLLTGSSAGGFGASINYPQTQDAFGDTPVALINDSGPPMSAAVFPPCLQTIFRDVWGFDQTMLAECGADCDDPSDYVLDYLDHVRRRFPEMRGGLFSSTQDTTIRSFAGYGWSGGYNMCGEIPSSVNATVFQDGLLALRAHVMESGAGFGTYFQAGTGHTVLRSPRLYSTSIGGVTPAQWMADTLAGTTGHTGP